jgi:hypothetical protein
VLPRLHILPILKIHFKHIFKLQTILNENIMRTSSHLTCSQNSFEENLTVCMAYVKQTNFGAKVSLFVGHFLFFCTTEKNLYFTKLCLRTYNLENAGKYLLIVFNI